MMGLEMDMFDVEINNFFFFINSIVFHTSFSFKKLSNRRKLFVEF